MKKALSALGGWLLENKRTVAALVLVLAAYGLSKAPGLEEEKQLLEYLWIVLGLGGIGFAPSFHRLPKKGDE